MSASDDMVLDIQLGPPKKAATPAVGARSRGGVERALGATGRKRGKTVRQMVRAAALRKVRKARMFMAAKVAMVATAAAVASSRVLLGQSTGQTGLHIKKAILQGEDARSAAMRIVREQLNSSLGFTSTTAGKPLHPQMLQMFRTMVDHEERGLRGAAQIRRDIPIIGGTADQLMIRAMGLGLDLWYLLGGGWVEDKLKKSAAARRVPEAKGGSR